MRKVTRWLLWAFVFTVPWDTVLFPVIGALSRVVGIVTLGVAALTIATEGRVRRPNAICGLAVAFTVFAVLSLFWTISYPATVVWAWTYAQLLGIVFIVREFARTREEQEPLLVAFCLGAFVPMADLLNNFQANIQIGSSAGRFSSGGALSLNANDLGFTLVIAIPMAWYLIRHSGGIVRIMALIYLALAPIAILLTGTRGGFLAGIVALSIVPLTPPRQSLRSFFLGTVLLVVLTATTAVVMPKSIWARISTIRSEITQGGPMSGRREIWAAGLSVFLEHPLLGVGAGAYRAALEQALSRPRPNVSHNTLLGVLVEEGLVGFCVFAALLGACARTIFGLPLPDRKLWAVLMLSWLVGVMSTNWEQRKPTWLLFGLIAAQSAAETTRRQLSQSQRNRTATDPSARAARLRPVYSRTVAQRAGR